MKTVKFFTLLSIFVLLCACSSAPRSVYKPATNAGFGYKESVLGENHYRVEFKITGTAKKAKDFALLRAAEITNTQGYDWFVVIKQERISGEENKFSSPDLHSRALVTRKCGLLMCRDNVQPPSDSGWEDMSKSEDSIVMLEIKLGKGIRPALDNTFDAIEISDKMRAQYSLK